ncbi:hypothetical protein LX32DRAFT_280266 [Colletotrichum zoysiae]|uniref:Uncharacterized protein n=1 Tax=Colletotrichum zoysiae TaxID=1216348 RepID=A0AAD9HM18_9PEZI|nr:hypothetical protein LX32DRAFT_280266 [Colletotrichum zoysiae]
MRCTRIRRAAGSGRRADEDGLHTAHSGDVVLEEGMPQLTRWVPRGSIWRVGVHGEAADVGIACRMTAVRRPPERSTRHVPGESPGDIAKRASECPMGPGRPRKRGDATQRHGVCWLSRCTCPTVGPGPGLGHGEGPDETFRSNGRGPSQRARVTSTAESLVATVRWFSSTKTPSETRSWPAKLSQRRPDAYPARGQSLDLPCCANKRECDLRPPSPPGQTDRAWTIRVSTRTGMLN